MPIKKARRKTELFLRQQKIEEQMKQALKIIEGGKADEETSQIVPIMGRGNSPRNPDWLIELRIGTSFISSNSYLSSTQLDEYTVKNSFKEEGLVLLRYNSILGTLSNSTLSWVDSEEFSRKNKLRKIL
jgi:hypothetical protein